MWEEILKAIPVLLSAMLKFILGPIGGKAAGLHLITTMVATAGGMMASVIAFTYFGAFIRKHIVNRFFKDRPERNLEGRSATWYKKYGLPGIAFLTPVILTPIGGTLLAVGLGGPREKILFYMLISACLWSAALTSAVYFGYDFIVDLVQGAQWN
ncbi:MAG: hypothetical protein ACK5DD_08195 [Cyclobacteriaceae bacterium]|jgi:membrane protein DedA with SNARE-associated domain